jgi:hypothetical protein
MGKLLLGSIAEQVFRHADCFVVTVGPGSYKDSLVEKTGAARPFLLATDFGAASLHAALRHLLRQSVWGKTRCATRSSGGSDTGRFSLV